MAGVSTVAASTRNFPAVPATWDRHPAGPGLAGCQSHVPGDRRSAVANGGTVRRTQQGRVRRQTLSDRRVPGRRPGSIPAFSGTRSDTFAAWRRCGRPGSSARGSRNRIRQCRKGRRWLRSLGWKRSRSSATTRHCKGGEEGWESIGFSCSGWVSGSSGMVQNRAHSPCAAAACGFEGAPASAATEQARRADGVDEGFHAAECLQPPSAIVIATRITPIPVMASPVRMGRDLATRPSEYPERKSMTMAMPFEIRRAVKES
jgi:hypothetical protein